MKKKGSKNPFMSYQDRLLGYERDKHVLLSTMAHLPASEFAAKLKELQDKWRI